MGLLQRLDHVSLIHSLRQLATENPSRIGFTFLEDGETEKVRWTYGELDIRARAVAAWLQDAGLRGERALLLYPPGLDFLAGFLGCLYAGVVAVPTYPPRLRRISPRLRGISEDCRPAAVLATAAIARQTGALTAEIPELAGAKWLETDGLATDELGLEGADRWEEPPLAPDDLAFLQYTSGSTAAPKGVMVSHGNLLHNEEMIRRAFGQTADSVVVSWLPPYHDMGLIGGLLQPLYTGARCVLMAPLAFLQRPRRWLEAVSRYRADTSGGPNFAYELCVRRAGDPEDGALDLSSWRVAFSGAEPVRAATLDRFTQAFAPAGFRRTAFYPCYGLAEATLFVAGGEQGAEPVVLDVEGKRSLVGCGTAGLGQSLVIADPETTERRLPEQVGEIWVAGPSVAQGYWRQPEATERDFHARLAGEPAAGSFLRTGDLGLVANGQLFITGRRKDLIILRGRNHYPQDIELTAEQAHPALLPGGGAAFAVEVDGEERLIVVQEVERRAEARIDLGAVAEAVRRAVVEEHEAAVEDVVLLRAGTLPKTSSGKVQRYLCRELYRDGRLPRLGAAQAPGRPAELPEMVLRRETLEADLIREVARRAGTAVERIDPSLPLTALGLDSLAAEELKHDLESRLGLHLSLATLLESSLADLVASLGEGAAPAPSGGPELGDHPLSPGQRALWFLHRLAPESAAYNIAAGLKTGTVDAAALTRALQRLTARHPALRTTFHAPAGEPVQRVHAAMAADVAVMEGPQDQEELRRLLGREADRPFDLESGPLLRVRLVGTAILLVIHHLVADFWSLAVLARELGAIYREETGGPPTVLDPLPLSFSDVVDWQRRRLEGAPAEAAWSYWRERLAGSPAHLDLLTDRPRPPIQTFRGATVVRRLDDVPVEGLAALAMRGSATLFMAVLAAYDVLLQRFTGGDDILVGAPTSGRDSAAVAGVVGYFVNPVVLRADLSGDPSFLELLERTRRGALGAFAHQDLPFPLLAERLSRERDPSRSPVFQTLFSWQAPPPGAGEGFSALALGWDGVPIRLGDRLGDLAGESVGFSRSGAQLDLSLQMAVIGGSGGGLIAALEHNTDLFDRTTALRMLRQLGALLAGIVEHPAARLSELPRLAAAERQQILVEWNDTAAPLPDAMVHELFAAQARASPERPALCFEGLGVTYRDLDERSNRLARLLRRRGVGPEVRVAVALERSPEILVALLAVLKAGGAYVPLDPGHPEERTAYVLADSGAAVVIRDGDTDAGNEPADELPRLAGPDHLAYVIYTSGSTGRPKGVGVRHRELSNFLAGFQRELNLTVDDVLLAVTTVSFDIAGLELYLPLVAGARIELVSRATAADGTQLATALRESGTTILQATPATWRLLLAAGWAGDPELTALCGGEALPRDLAAELLPRVRSLRNVYGPTETTIWSALDVVGPGAGAVPIGRPIANTAIHLLDPWAEPVPLGAAGELTIGGAGLARGYLGRPELTAQAFVPDPFGGERGKRGETGGRLYRTGDLARFLADGTIQSLGRIDHQVKIRGFRVEPGEIERVLAEHSAVHAGAVVLRGDRLVAFLVAESSEPPPAAEMRAHARRRLPDYMVPSAMVWLPALPLTSSGKVDRTALSRLELIQETEEGGDGSPASPVEELLAGIWSELLDAQIVGRIGAQDDFFALGGHSLLATRLVARLRAVFGAEIALGEVFRHPTLSGLAAVVESSLRGAVRPSPPLVPVPRDRPLPLSFAQQRLWFLDQLDRVKSGGSAYVMPGAFRLDGPLDVPALQSAFAEIARRHEALRTVFMTAEGIAIQRIVPAGGVALPVVDLGGLSAQAQETELARLAAEEAGRPFDLARGPLLRLRLVRLAAERHALLVTLHHIAADGWSLGVLGREVAVLYPAFAAGRPSPLPELPIQYADFAVWQRRWADAGGLDEQADFWRRELAGAPPVLELPADRPRPASPSERGMALPVGFAVPLGRDLAALGRREGATLFMVLLAGFAALLQRGSGQGEVVIGTPVANRDRLETEGLIGFFANLLALRVSLEDRPSFADLLGRVRARALAAYAHQDLPFERLVEELQPERSLAVTPLFQVLLVLQDEPATAPVLPGLKTAPLPVHNGAVRFDLTLALGEALLESDSGLVGTLEFSRDLFDATTVRRLAHHLEALLRGAAAAPGRPLDELALLSAAERQQLVAEWNDTEAPVPALAAHQIVEEQARRRPDAPALRFGGETLTYRELDRRADRLAGFLRRQGVGPEVLVVLALERSLETFVALLAVLKAGGAFLPLDINYPAERLAFMLEDCGAPLLLTQTGVLARLPPHSAATVCLDDLDELDELDGLSEGELPPCAVDPDHLAYVIYTSGSTGRPKGVEVTHGGLANFTLALDGVFRLRPGQRVLQLASLSFDAAVWEIFMAWGAGACLHIARRETVLPGAEMLAVLEEQEIAAVSMMPSSLALLPREALPHLEVLVVGAEACPPEVAAWWRQGRRFYNTYGPTEATISATIAVDPGADGRAPIGRPLANVQTYLLDERLLPAPAGVPGELYVGGVGVGRGYLGQPGLTAERFVPDGLGGGHGARLYRTGDLARHLTGGEIDFLGRVDTQVKVRGFRIELGEIEAVLAEHPAVRRAAVALRDDLPGGRGVAAYAALEAGETTGAAALRDFLADRLPPYMVPAAITILEKLPLQPNGKVDRRALPAPSAPDSASGRPFVAPRNFVEHRLAAVWAEVLGRETIGVQDDFFDLGGHSLLAIRLAHEVGQALGVEVPVARLFEAPTVELLARALEAEGEAAEEAFVLPPLRRTTAGAATVPASFAQRRLWLLDQLDPGEATYNLPFAVHVTGALDLPALEKSLAEIVRRHEALRTTFRAEAGEPVQVLGALSPGPSPVRAPAHPPRTGEGSLLTGVVEDSTSSSRVVAPLSRSGWGAEARAGEGTGEGAGWGLPVVDLRGLQSGPSESARLASEEARRPFDLAVGPLLRAMLLRLGEAESVLVLNMHHIVSDAWSIGVFVRELKALYGAFRRGEPSPLAEPAVQYADFTLWQRAWMRGEALAEQLDYWREQLRDLPALSLPTDRPLGARPGRRGGSHGFLLAPALTAAVAALGRRESATPAMVLLAAFEALLGRWTGEDDFAVGTAVANRRWPEIDDLIGFFVNTLVLRAPLAGDPAFRELMGRVRDVSLAAFAYQELPFEMLVEELAPERTLAHSPFFRVVFNLQNAPLPPLDLPGAVLRAEEVETGAAKFDIALSLWESADGLAGQWTWSREAFDASTVLRLHAQLETLLAGAVVDPAAAVSRLPLLPAAQRHQVLTEWRGTPTPFPRDATIHELFAAQAKLTPETVAVGFAGRTLTYRELNERADRLAWQLRGLGVMADVRVGVSMERSLETIVALLAILKAGGAYIPLDPAAPEERKSFLIEDAGVAVLIVQERFASSLPDMDLPVIRLDEGASSLAGWTDGAPPDRSFPESLAYVLYTSGSTGRPKGVGVSHRNVARLVCETDYLDFLTSDVFLQIAPLSFDASTVEIWGPLLHGARLELFPPHAPSLEELAAFLEENRITVAFLTAGLFHQMAERHAPVLRLRRLLAGGDVVSPAHARLLLAEPGSVLLTNCYGPTESTTFTTTHPVRRLEELGETVPIGRPIANTAVRVLGRHLEAVAAGALGELLIGGDGLARGYPGRPDLTAERFVPDPLAEEPGARLYRTGDLVRYLADGLIDFLGRVDRQVKIRGFRIEPGEVEAALQAHPDIRDAVVAVRRDGRGDRQLVAYAVADETVPPGSLRDFLRGRLPDFMIPSAFVVLPELPLTPNGKVDRDRLPAPEAGAPREEIAAPGGPGEELLAGIWSELLGRPVGRRDNFFEMGGHSLLATQAVSRVREVFGVELPLRALFEAPTVEALAARIAATQGGPDLAPLLPVPRTGDLPASFAQERLWFLDQMSPGSPLYNVPGAWRLTGRLDRGALDRSLRAIVHRHEALRTTFTAVDGRPVQVVGHESLGALPLADLNGLPAAAREKELERLVGAESRRPFDLARGPLLRVCLVRLAAEEHALLLTLHHIVSDGWSVGVFARELAALYEGRSLPDLPVQYPDFAVWQRQWLRGEALETQIAHWRQVLAGIPPGLDLPVDRPRPPVVGVEGRSLPLDLGTLAPALDELGRRQGATLFMILLAAFAATLQRFAGSEDVVVGTPVANRTRRETEGLIGFFVNTLPLRLDLSNDPSFGSLLTRTRAVALAAWSHQDVPFEKLVEELRPERDPRFTPLFNVMLALDRPPEDLALPGLEATALGVETTTAKFELLLALERSGDRLGGRLECRRDLFDTTTAQRLADAFARLLTAAATDPQRPLSSFETLGPGEKQQLLWEWNDTASTYPRASLPELFAAQVRRSPDAEAVRFADGSLTYRELDRRSNRLAHRLLGLGVTPDAPVGLCMERSAAWVVAMLGILKAGGAYVPLDVGYPEERLAWMLADVGAAVVVGPGFEAGATTESDPRLVIGAIDPGQLAYVIYTSGSTGRPKGVAVTQQAVARLLFGTDYVDLGPDDRLAQVANASFDAATFEVWGALLHGGCLVGFDKDVVLSPRAFAAELERQRISAMFLTASLFNQMAREVPDAFRGVRHLLAGGEALDPRWVGRVLEHGGPRRLRRLLNGYGPTESTTFACWHEIESVPEGTHSIPIGRPLSNTRAYVLDRGLLPVPLGAQGELLLGGDGLARGYHGRPELTAERFVPDPFEPGSRLYRTGDLVRQRADGPIEFLGRIDEQVKIRGFRIEPGEVEGVLREHPAVRDCAVVVQETPRGLELVAYAVWGGDDDLIGFLRRRLPEHMVPASLVMLDALPLTPNGKLDRRALPRPDQAEAAARAPRTSVEEAVARVFAEVLGVERVGLDDDFFARGGHSLLATQAVSRLRDALGIELPLRDLFEAPTVVGIAERAESLLGAGLTRPPLLRRPASAGAAPLSFAQSRLWFLQRLEPDSPAYNMPMGLWLRGPLDADALERALAEVVQRHEVLRTSLVEVDGAPVQAVVSGITVRLPRVDARMDSRTVETSPPWPPSPIAPPSTGRGGKNEADLAARAGRGRPSPGGWGGDGRGDGGEVPAVRAVENIARDHALQPFDLSRPPLIRGLLVHTGDAEHLLLLTIHHVAFDGWSVGVLTRELAALYPAFLAGLPSPLQALPVQYSDFAVWQHAWLRGEALEAQLAYWRERLAGDPPVLELPADRPRELARSPRAGRFEMRLPSALAAALTEEARRRESTRFIVLLAGFAALLHRVTGVTGESDLVVGSPIANRTLRETEGLIGFFVNTLALRLRVAGGLSFADLLEQARETALGAYAHQDLPFEKLIEEVDPGRRPGQNPLFEVMFGQFNAPEMPAGLGGLEIEPARSAVEAAAFELTAMLFDSADGVTLALQYDAGLFDRTTVARWAAGYIALLGEAVAAPQQAVGTLALLGEGERHQMAVEWNDTASEIPRDSCIHEIFAEQVRRAPGRIAAETGEAMLTYGDLDRRANQVAHRLRALGAGAESPVGLCIERSLDMIVATLAILKVGGAYVPLAPEMPRERLAWMAADAGVEIVLTREPLLELLPLGLHVLCLDRDAAVISGAPETPPVSSTVPANLAYVMYTSGSTGRPKRVGVTHGNVVRFVRGTRLIEATPDEVFLQSAPISFDGTTFEIWGPLLNGGRTAVLPPHVPSLEELAAAVERHGVSTLWLTAGLFQQMVDGPLGRLRGVRRLLAGGDVLSAPHVEKALRELPGTLLFNGYGPTENTTGTSTHRVRAVRPGLPVPIGRPLANTEIHLLDASWELVPLGSPGELALGGEGVARGYLGRPELTAERFVPHPFGDGARLYRTGDLGRRLAGGEIEFLGRIDRQVKIRGFRVEPGEVEAALMACPGVREAAVDIRSAVGEKRLVAYLVPRDESSDLSAAALRAALKETLPEAMLPSAFVSVAALPLTANGKVDRRRLPEPVWEGSGAEGGAPRSQAEELLAGIWSEVLEIERVGVYDDFFALGGHSLMATRVVSRVREAFGVEIPLRLVFEEPTVAALAAVIERERLTGAGVPPEVVPVPRSGGDLPLSFAQQRLWFLDRLQPESPFYNLPAAVRLRGRLRPEVLARCFAEIVRRHEALRTSFPDAAGVPVQRVEPPYAPALPWIDLGGLPAAVRDSAVHALAAAEARRPFRLASEPLLRTLLLRIASDIAPEEHVLLLTMHHIVSDGWSIGVLLREVAALYAAFDGAFDGGLASPLPDLPVQYPDFAAWQRHWLQGEALERLLAYWRGHLTGAPPTVELPYDRPHPAIQSFRGAMRQQVLPARLAASLQTLSRRSGATLFMTLLAAFGAVLHRLSGQDDLVVGTPTANRNRREIEDLIGFFVNTMALRLRPGGSFRALLARTTASVLDAQAHQDLPFEKLVEELRPQRDLSRSPLFQVMLILQNAPLPALELPGLVLSTLEMVTGTARFELTLSVGELDGRWLLSAEHNTDLFDGSTIDRLLGHLLGLLQGAVEQPEARITDLPMLGAAESHQLLAEWSGAEQDIEGSDDCLHDLFTQQARRTPERIAVVVPGGGGITYGDLAERSTALARHLRTLGVGPEVPVGVLMERNVEMIVGLLAILKAGGAYVPLDPTYPEERRAFMLADTQAPVVLVDAAARKAPSPPAPLPAPPAPSPGEGRQATEGTNGHPEGELRELEGSGRAETFLRPDPLGGQGSPQDDVVGASVQDKPVLVFLPSPGERAGGAGRGAGGEGAFRPASTNLAYVIYTSGSTGRPKGVGITHGNAVAFLRWAREIFSPEDLTAVVATTSIGFDLSVFEIFAPLSCGGRVILLRDGLQLLGLPAELQPTLINTVPSVAAELARAMGMPASVRTVNLAGEPLRQPLVDATYGSSRVERVFNLYGPSEDTTYSTFALAERGSPAEPSIGRPVTGTRAYVLGPELDLLPAGMPGELCLGGAGLARGYLNRPELTAERFIPDPFSPDGVRLYRTGDRVRWLPGGALEYLGRIDQQVKIRGFRIELGEVETALREHPAVREAVVVARESGGLGKRLIAYFVPREEIGDLRAFLKKRLPDPMIPALFISLERLPLSPNGKVDRRALPDPEAGGSADNAALVPPRNELETVVAAVWSEVLERAAVGVHDNFFEIGGHSLLAVRAASRLQEELRRPVSVLELFEHPTVAALAAWLAARDGDASLLEGSRSRAAARRDSIRQRRQAPPKRTVSQDVALDEDVFDEE